MFLDTSVSEQLLPSVPKKIEYHSIFRRLVLDGTVSDNSADIPKPCGIILSHSYELTALSKKNLSAIVTCSPHYVMHSLWFCWTTVETVTIRGNETSACKLGKCQRLVGWFYIQYQSKIWTLSIFLNNFIILHSSFSLTSGSLSTHLYKTSLCCQISQYPRHEWKGTECK